MWNDLTLTLAQTSGDGAPTAGGEGAPTTGGSPANTTSTTQQTGDTPPPPAGPDGDFLFLMLIAVVFFMIIFSIMGGRKEKKKRAELMASMGKGDKVQTIGGVFGTIVEIKEDKVVLKVDENANTKIVFAKTAIQTVIQN